MKRKLIYFAAPLLLVLLVVAFQLSSVSQAARTAAGAPEQKCEQDCSDRFEDCARANGVEACRPALELCRQDSPKGPRQSGRRPR